MTISRLNLYNSALNHCGERKISSLSESVESRRVLDSAWDEGAVDYCLEAGLWKFAMRTVQIDYSPSVEPDFGYSRAFDKPTDFIRTAAVCSDEFFKVPLLEYVDEAGFWFTDLDTIYVRYISNDSAYGGDYSLWTQTFARYVAAHLASQAITKLSQDEAKWKKVEFIKDQALKDALSRDAQADPTKFPPQGSWVNARGRGRRRDGGNRGSLIG